jgi:hypothetical protein
MDMSTIVMYPLQCTCSSVLPFYVAVPNLHYGDAKSSVVLEVYEEAEGSARREGDFRYEIAQSLRQDVFRSKDTGRYGNTRVTLGESLPNVNQKIPYNDDHIENGDDNYEIDGVDGDDNYESWLRERRTKTRKREKPNRRKIGEEKKEK